MSDVAALFVDPKGIYPELLGRGFCWANEPDYSRDPAGDDARLYAGSLPVVAHPTCSLWVNFAASNYARAIVPCPACEGAGGVDIGGEWCHCDKCEGTGRREPNRKVVLPAWYPGGDDGGCFASALANVRRCGGVLEHPAGSHAWEAHGLLVPPRDVGLEIHGPLIRRARGSGWTSVISRGAEYWVCEVWQSAYGHAARKRTWLLYCGKRPPLELRWAREPGTHQIGWFDRAKPTLGKKAASATPRAFAEELIRLAEWSQG